MPVKGMSTKCPLFHSDLGAKGARNAETEKTNVVFRRRLTREAMLSVAAEAIVCGIKRGCESIEI